MNRLLSHVGPPLRALQAVLRNGRITRMQLAFLLFNVAEPAMWVAIFVYAFDQGGTQEVGVVSILVLVPAGCWRRSPPRSGTASAVSSSSGSATSPRA